MIIPRVALAACLVVGSSTGAHAEDFPRAINQAKYCNSFVCGPESYLTDDNYVRTPAEDVARVREIIAPAISDLARSFNVSRQTVYNWLSGSPPTEEHSAKLQDLAFAADLFAESGIPVTGSLLKRKVHNGKSFFEEISAGGSAKEAAQLIIQITSREQGQRELLAARFAGRRVPKNSADSDLMAENDRV
jgi:transcriptional regulator with XRE-family HTH domain